MKMNVVKRITHQFPQIKAVLPALAILFNTSAFGFDTQGKTEPTPRHTTNIYPYVFQREGRSPITFSQSHRYFPLIHNTEDTPHPRLVEVSDPGQIPADETGQGISNFWSYSVNTFEISVGRNQLRYMVAGTNGYETLNYVLPDGIRNACNEHIESNTLSPVRTFRSLLPDRPDQGSQRADRGTPDSIEAAISRIIQPDQNGYLSEELVRFSEVAFSQLSSEFLDSLSSEGLRRVMDIQNISFKRRAETLANVIREQNIELLLVTRTSLDEYEAMVDVFNEAGFSPQLVVASQGQHSYTSNDEIMHYGNPSLISAVFIRFSRGNVPSNFNAVPVDVGAIGVTAVEGYQSNQNLPAAVDVNFASEDGDTVRLIGALTGPSEPARAAMMNDIGSIVANAPSSSVMPFYSFKSESYNAEHERLVSMGGRAITDRHPIIFLRDKLGGAFPYNADSQEAKLLAKILRRYWSLTPCDDSFSTWRRPDDDFNRRGPGLGGIGTGS